MNFDSIYNYYERLVYEEVMRFLNTSEDQYTIDDAEDIACLALNKLPARYVRHSVDTAFYLPENERQHMLEAVADAVAVAFERVRTHPSRTGQ